MHPRSLSQMNENSRARSFLFDKPMKCFAFLFTFCFQVYFSRSYESRSNEQFSFTLNTCRVPNEYFKFIKTDNTNMACHSAAHSG